MKKILSGLSFLIICVTNMVAQSPIEAFLTMPQELCPYFNEAQRNAIGQQLVVAMRENDTTILHSVPNLFGKESRPLSLTDKSMCLQIADGIEYGWLVDNNKIILIQTLCSPICSSVVSEYDMDWHRIRTIRPEKDGVFFRAHIENDTLVFTDETPEEDLAD